MFWINLMLLFAFAKCEKSQINVTETYIHSATLRSGNIILHWKFTETHITFEVHGETEGWIGIGFSPNGAMTGADIIVGWVKDGKVQVTDRHGVANAFPPKDTKQDIEVLAGKECNGWTMFKFTRQLAACESEYDRTITAGTQRLIWAFGSTDPDGDDITSNNYHSTNRGVESMYFLDSADDPSDQLPADQEFATFDILEDELHIPAVPTYYNCKMFKIPELSQKNHIVKVEPIIKEGHEMNVHHILIYQCGNVMKNVSELGVDIDCRNAANMQHFQTCTSLISAWAIGGGAQFFPDVAGLSIGAPGDPIYIQAETHYDNPTMRGDIVDSSGLRFTYTSKLRQYDVGVMQVGNLVDPQRHFIPPGAESFLNVAYCAGDCVKERLAAANTPSITVFGIALHSHLAGRDLRLRHYRNGEELPYLASDDSYDFNYQEMRYVTPPVEVLPTDVMRMDCVFNTEDRDQMTLAGFGTPQEMCLSFVFFYPRIDLTFCISAPVRAESWRYFGIDESEQTGEGNSLEDFTVTSPEELSGKTVMDVMSNYNWTEDTIDQFSKEYMEMHQVQLCVTSQDNLTEIEYFKPPEVTSEYEEPVQICVPPERVMSQTRDTEDCNSSTSTGCNMMTLLLSAWMSYLMLQLK